MALIEMTTVIERNKQKIASFRTKEGDWADFAAHAEKNGFTATDILRSAMSQYVAGSFDPVNTSVSTVTRSNDQIQELLDTAIAPLQKEIERLGEVLAPIQKWIAHSDTQKQQTEGLDQLVNTAVSTAIDRLDIDRLVVTAVNTAVSTTTPNSPTSSPPLGAKAAKTRSTPQAIPADLDTANGLSHAQLAKLLAKNTSTLSRWASGKRQIPSDIAAKWIFADGKWYPKTEK
jgi:hypothetical protein